MQLVDCDFYRLPKKKKKITEMLALFHRPLGIPGETRQNGTIQFYHCFYNLCMIEALSFQALCRRRSQDL